MATMHRSPGRVLDRSEWDPYLPSGILPWTTTAPVGIQTVPGQGNTLGLVEALRTPLKKRAAEAGGPP